MSKQSSFVDAAERSEVAQMKHGSAALEKKFTIRIRVVKTGNEWNEEYTAKTDNPEQWGRDIVAFFNRTLRPGESPREFVGLIGDVVEVPPPEHAWFKTTAMTQNHATKIPFDRMQCERCGITGKRFGIGRPVTRDSVWRAKVYAQCDTTIAHQRGRRQYNDHDR